MVLNLGSIIDDFGNMTKREDVTNSLKEEFEYDPMNRLKLIEYYESGIHQSNDDITLTYDGAGYGNMTNKSDVGDFIYEKGLVDGGTAGPHALTNIINTVGSLPRNQDIAYNSFNKVQWVQDTLANDELLTLNITYGVDNLRRQTVCTNSGSGYATKTKYFFGDYEEIHTYGSSRYYNYVYAPTGLCAIYEADVSTGSNDKLWHVNTDHLGSITYMIDADNSSNTKEYSFNAWGVQRNPDDWMVSDPNPLYADKGFTGHEHLSDFVLINMNGRVYDPILARYLSPDPYVQIPGVRGGFNRYSYCLNNPLVYTDPDGEIIFTTICTLVPGLQPFIPIAIGTDIGWMTGGIRGAKADDMTFWGGAWRGGLVGAVGGGLSMIGGGTFVANVAWGMTEGAITGGLDAALWGKDVGESMLYGAAIGGAFAFGQSTIEALKNFDAGYGFRTNEGVMKNLFNDGEYEKLIFYTELRYGLNKTLDRESVWITYEDPPAYDTDIGTALEAFYEYEKYPAYSHAPTGDIVFRDGAFESLNSFKAHMLHEFGHVNLDRNGIIPFYKGDPYLLKDGLSGYKTELYNSGLFHISPSYLKQSNLYWNDFGIKKWFYATPRRFPFFIIK